MRPNGEPGAGDVLAEVREVVARAEAAVERLARLRRERPEPTPDADIDEGEGAP